MLLDDKIQVLKDITKHNKIRYEDLAKTSGVPLSTIKAVFCGQIQSPSLRTYNALSNALSLNHLTPEEQLIVTTFRRLSSSNKYIAHVVLDSLSR